MNRRSFLGAILAAGAAPAIVRADSLMRVVVRPDSGLITYGWVEVSQSIIIDSDWRYAEGDPVIFIPNDEYLIGRMTQSIVKNNAILKRMRDCGIRKPAKGGLIVRDE